MNSAEGKPATILECGRRAKPISPCEFGTPPVGRPTSVAPPELCSASATIMPEENVRGPMSTHTGPPKRGERAGGERSASVISARSSPSRMSA